MVPSLMVGGKNQNLKICYENFRGNLPWATLGRTDFWLLGHFIQCSSRWEVKREKGLTLALALFLRALKFEFGSQSAHCRDGYGRLEGSRGQAGGGQRPAAGAPALGRRPICRPRVQGRLPANAYELRIYNLRTLSRVSCEHATLQPARPHFSDRNPEYKLYSIDL